MNNISEIIIPLMRRAGKIMLEAENVEAQDSLSEKGDAANLVTVYDVAVQNFLLSEIKKAIPDATFVSFPRALGMIMAFSPKGMAREQTAQTAKVSGKGSRSIAPRNSSGKTRSRNTVTK